MNLVNELEKIINEIFTRLEVKPLVKVSEFDEETLVVDIEGDNLSFLIGYRGESLEGLQTVLGLILFKRSGEWKHIVVDINGYKRAKMERIERIAKNYIDKVRFLGKEMELPPMNPFERRHVHLLISGYTDIMSESHGEGSQRRVVLKPALQGK